MDEISKILTENPIFITTYKAKKLPTIENLPIKWRKFMRVIVSDTEDEILVHDKYPGVTTIYVPPQGIPGIRQHLLDHAMTYNIPCLVMLDDDLQFKTGIWEDGKKRFRNSTEQQLTTSFTLLTQQVLHNPHVSFSAHGSAFFNATEHEWELCKGNTYSFFVNTDTARLSGATFNDIPTMEDIKFSLQSYQAGYPSYSNMHHSVVDVGLKGATGEAAHPLPRSIRHEDALDILLKMFPGLVRERVNNSKAHLENIGTSRDATVSWKQALKK